MRLDNRHGQTNRRARRGFTLIECIVSIAIFAIMGTMFASFMMSSVRVVNLTLANDRDREALLEAISSANSGECDTANGKVTIGAIDKHGDQLKLEIDVGGLDKAVLEDKYVRYTAPNGTKYSIYLGSNAMTVRYLVLMNLKDNEELKKAIAAKQKSPELTVVYRGENQQFAFVVDASDPRSIVEIVLDDKKEPYYVRYESPIGEKYLIYFCKIEETPEPPPNPPDPKPTPPDPYPEPEPEPETGEGGGTGEGGDTTGGDTTGGDTTGGGTTTP